MNNPKTRLISLGFAVILLVVLFTLIIIAVTRNASNDTNDISPTPQEEIVEPNYKTIKNAPTIEPESGGGINEDSVQVKNSIAQIQKLNPSLPYEESFTSSTGIDVVSLIPARSLQSNTFTLSVEVFGIDYNVSPNDSDYESQKKSFIEGAKKIISWISARGVDPKKIIFSWGDREYIQNQAKEWLKSIE